MDDHEEVDNSTDEEDLVVITKTEKIFLKVLVCSEDFEDFQKQTQQTQDQQETQDR